MRSSDRGSRKGGRTWVARMAKDDKAAAVTAIGLMSGTSLDGIDAAVLITEGDAVAIPGAELSVAYDPGTRALLREALEALRTYRAGDPAPPAIAGAEKRLTDAHGEAVKVLLARAGLGPRDIAYIGFHGQTVLHRPAERLTWQIGDAARLANALGIPVVSRFREADVAAGGQGAPFVPLYHLVLVRGMERPVAVVNIGGVANVTYVGADNSLIAFDTGPGNAALDDWAVQHTGEPMDRDGRLARAGQVNAALLAHLLGHPMFEKPPPKSLDRFDFPMALAEGLGAADGAATLTAFTAATIARAAEHFPQPPRRWIVCGGGRHNPALMAELGARLEGAVMTAEDAGWHGDFLEAEAFAYLAVRSARGLPLSLPSTTGVSQPMPGGTLTRPAA
jgi:anhydro-N-acetylmuramic acid kinase